MTETTGFWSKVRDYLKYRPASSASRGWVKAGKVLIPVAIIFVLFRIGIPPLHVIPIWGPSMQPTMQVWNLPEPREKWSFSGWVHYDPDKKPEIGNIVYFRVPNTKFREIKRVSEINDLGLLYVLPDNTGVSGEGSDNSDLYKWLCPESVIGVVDAIWTPTRAIRWLTAEGRFRNGVEMEYAPRKYIEGDDGFLISDGNDLLALTVDGECKRRIDIWGDEAKCILEAQGQETMDLYMGLCHEDNIIIEDVSIGPSDEGWSTTTVEIDTSRFRQILMLINVDNLALITLISENSKEEKELRDGFHIATFDTPGVATTTTLSIYGEENRTGALTIKSIIGR